MRRASRALLPSLLAAALLVQTVTPCVHAQEAKPSRDNDGKRIIKGEAMKGDAFGSKNWKPAPPMKKVVKSKPVVAPVVVAPPPPPPSAPPLPFTYIGKLVDGGVTTVFLAHRQANLAVKVGEVVENTYRLEQVTDSTITLTYLPLNAQQQMSLGGPR